AACLAGTAHKLRRKPQTHASPDRVDHTLRLRERNGTRIAGCNKALLPGIDSAALVIPDPSHGSNGFQAPWTGRLRFTRSPAAKPCRNAPFVRACVRLAGVSSRFYVCR